MTSRKLVRIALASSLAIALAVAVVALLRLGPAEETSWALLASVLAVVASCVSAWSGQRLLEMAEDDKEPQLLLAFDVASCYQLVQLRLKNIGGTSAHDVRISWDRPLQTVDGNAAKFSDAENGPEVKILAPGESVSTMLGVSHRFMEMYRNSEFSGEMAFKTSAGRKREEGFLLSTASLGRRLQYDEEELRTHYDLQRIPGALESLTRELQQIRLAFEQRREPDADGEG